MKNSDGSISRVSPELRRLKPNREINQFGGIPGLLTFDHTWSLEPAQGGTRVIQHEEYRGIYVWFWDPAWVEQAYHDGLVSLSQRVATKSS